MATEKRLIDANEMIATLEKIADEDESEYFHLDEITQEIFDAPTVDAVEVVRCENCKKGHKTEREKQLKICWCDKWHNIMRYWDFCSYGERKTENDFISRNNT